MPSPMMPHPRNSRIGEDANSQGSEADREDEVGQHQDAAAARSVDPRSGPRTHNGRNHHRHRECAEDPDRGQVEILGHGTGEDRRDVVTGRPTHREGRAEGVATIGCAGEAQVVGS